MEKEEIKDYISKLQNFESQLKSDDEEIDLNFISELDDLLLKLNTDVQKNMITNSLAIEIKVKKTHPNAVIPSYSKDGDAGMDLTITEIYNETEKDITYGFGIAMEIPRNYVGLIFPRSSVRKYDLSLTNCVGVIDSGYRGEIQSTFKKTNTDATVYGIGERGAQIIILPYPQIKFVETDNLSYTERGDGGFGSTGS